MSTEFNKIYMNILITWFIHQFIMAFEEGDKSRLNGMIASIIESDYTIEAFSNPTAPLLGAGEESGLVSL